MLFTWKDGYSKEFKFGLKARGLKHNNQRPISVSLNPKEIMNRNFSKEEFYAYLHQLNMVLCPHSKIKE